MLLSFFYAESGAVNLNFGFKGKGHEIGSRKLVGRRATGVGIKKEFDGSLRGLEAPCDRVRERAEDGGGCRIFEGGIGTIEN